jgi:hypothetical protein
MNSEEKNNKYWELHKEIWNEKFDSLDLFICRRIMGNPHGPEGQRFNRLVERKVLKILRGERKFSRVVS